MNLILAVAFMGAAGAVARLLISSWVSAPWGIMLCNLLGCFAMGLVYCNTRIEEPLKAFIMIGFLGAFTTFSSFALDINKMMAAGQWGLMAFYIGISNVVGIGLCYLGTKINLGLGAS